MPAEWERHEATWLVWPKNPGTFPSKIIRDVENIYVKMIKELAQGEKVELLVDDERTEHEVSSLIDASPHVKFHKIRTSDVWIRDYGPIFVGNSEKVAMTKWVFNAWGNKYDDLKPDNETGMRIAQSTGLDLFQPQMVLEGGSIDVNGLGTCITTKQCLLNKNRNPNLTQNEIANYLKEYLGITNLIWLDAGIAGDDTDGHVDDIARFVNANTVLCLVEDDPTDENHEILKRNLMTLRESTDQNGNKMNVIPIQMPNRIDSEDSRLPASYANFYIGNSVVLVPIFEDPKDEEPLNMLRRFYPDRKVVGVNCRSLVYGLGAIHCVTQQQPNSG